MTPSRLTGLFGATLRRERQRQCLTQEQLARRAAVSQPTIARLERGNRQASPPTLERLFAALGLQLTVGVEPLDAHIDAAIDELIAKPLADRVAETDIHRVMDKLTVPYVFDGATAALLQGAPVPTGDVEVAIRWADAEEFTEWLTANYGQRWHAQWQTFGYLRLDPRDPGDHRWRTIPGVLRARMCDRLPAAIEVVLDDRRHPVVPLTELEIDDPRTAGLVRRYRARRARVTS